MLTTTEPIVDFCNSLFSGTLIFNSPIMKLNFSASPVEPPLLADWCWLILPIDELSELVYADNHLRNYLAVLTIQKFNDTITQVQANCIFQDCSEQQIINTIQTLCRRLNLIEPLKAYARQEIKNAATSR